MPTNSLNLVGTYMNISSIQMDEISDWRSLSCV